MTSSAGHQQAGGHGQVERLGSLEIQDRLVPGRQLHRKLRGQAATQNAIDIGRCLPERLHEVGYLQLLEYEKRFHTALGQKLT
jgi:hypothetical protein